MIKKINKNAIRKKRHERMRSRLSGTAETPRLNVYRSTNHVYVQFIDDVAGVTLASASDLDPAIKAQTADKTKCETAKIVGIEAGKRAMEKGIKAVVFDRGGYLYTGRVAKVAEGAREAGLDF